MEQEYTNIVDRFINDKMFNIVIVSLISADAILTIDDAYKSKKTIDKLVADLETSVLKTEWHEKTIKNASELIDKIIERDFNNGK